MKKDDEEPRKQKWNNTECYKHIRYLCKHSNEGLILLMLGTRMKERGKRTLSFAKSADKFCCKTRNNGPKVIHKIQIKPMVR